MQRGARHLGRRGGAARALGRELVGARPGERRRATLAQALVEAAGEHSERNVTSVLLEALMRSVQVTSF